MELPEAVGTRVPGGFVVRLRFRDRGRSSSTSGSPTTQTVAALALRAAFVGAMLIGMIIVWQSTLHRVNLPDQRVSIKQMAEYGEALYLTVVSIELTLVLLAAPAATAGSVCLDKPRGTLDHMLATDLSNAEIVLGKLRVRLPPVLGLIACVLPITGL